MKISTFILILLLALPAVGFSQYKEQSNSPSIAESLRMPTTYNGGLLLGFLDMAKIQMQHSYSMGFSSGGYGSSGSYGLYMNSILYPVNEKLQLVESKTSLLEKSLAGSEVKEDKFGQAPSEGFKRF